MLSKWRLTASLLAIFCAVLLAGDRPAHALSASQSMGVSLTVGNACTLSTNPLAFGTWSSVADVNATTTISLNCTNAAAWSVDIDAGLHQLLANNTRYVTGGPPVAPSGIAYSLYKDNARTTLWGTGTGIGSGPLTGVGTGAAQALTVFATARSLGVNGPTPPPPGSYTDTVIVAVTF